MRSGLIWMVFVMAALAVPAGGWGGGLGDDLRSGDIYVWVAGQMDVPGDDGLPPIQLVSKVELQRLFENSNQQSYHAWTAAYGSGRARRMMDIYLKDLVGMFNPSTGVVYVGCFLSPCRQKAILAHELVHYIQHENQSQQDLAMAVFDPDAVNMVREMEAYKIQNRFTERFCPDRLTH